MKPTANTRNLPIMVMLQKNNCSYKINSEICSFTNQELITHTWKMTCKWIRTSSLFTKFAGLWIWNQQSRHEICLSTYLTWWCPGRKKKSIYKTNSEICSSTKTKLLTCTGSLLFPGAQVTDLPNRALSVLSETKTLKCVCARVRPQCEITMVCIYTVRVQKQQIQHEIRFQASCNLIKSPPSVSPKQH